MLVRTRRGLTGLGLTAATLLGLTGTAVAHPEHDGGFTAADGARDAQQHGVTAGHLPATSSNVEVLSKLKLKSVVPEKVADVSVFGNYAYLAAWGGPGTTCDNNGVHVVDISDVRNPVEVGFVRSKVGSYPGEGVHVVRIDTPAFTGDILATNNEKCDDHTGYGGVNLYDVTNPGRIGQLFEGAGDATANGIQRKQANEIHSAFVWDAGEKAYAALVDNEEGADLDILDITDPRRPVLVKEYDVDQAFPQVLQSAPDNLSEVFLHDMVVKKIGQRYIMSASYWDAGYVLLDVTDPVRATYVADTDFTNPDPELRAQTGLVEKPEGNAHQSEFTADNKYLLGADEDFTPNATVGHTDDDATVFQAPQGSGTPQLRDGESLSGRTVYVGRACDVDAAVPPASGTGQVAVVARGLCTFTEKMRNVDGKGYVAAIVVNREGSDGCGLFGMSVDGATPSFSVDRRTGFGFFDKEAAYDEDACLAGTASEIPGVTLGALGDVVNLRAFFDGWGYVHLFRNGTGKLAEVDTYAIPEAMDPAKAAGFGDLSVHEVATSARNSRLAYLSYYSGGLRVVKINETPRGTTLQEVGRFIDAGGNNFWGVEVFTRGSTEYVAVSDRDHGLYILRYTGNG